MTYRPIPDDAAALYHAQREERLGAWDALVALWEREDAATEANRAKLREQHDNGTRDHDAAFVERWGSLPGAKDAEPAVELPAEPVPVAEVQPPTRQQPDPKASDTA